MPMTLDGSAGMTAPQGAVYNGLQTGTSVTLNSGTSVEFTNIPSWAKRVTLVFSDLGTSGSTVPIAQLGTASSYETSSYLGSGISNGTTYNITTGLNFRDAWGSSATFKNSGAISITLIDAVANLWVMTAAHTNSVSPGVVTVTASKALAGALTRVRITIGANTFVTGTINVVYE